MRNTIHPVNIRNDAKEGMWRFYILSLQYTLSLGHAHTRRSLHKRFRLLASFRLCFFVGICQHPVIWCVMTWLYLSVRNIWLRVLQQILRMSSTNGRNSLKHQNAKVEFDSLRELLLYAWKYLSYDDVFFTKCPLFVTCKVWIIAEKSCRSMHTAFLSLIIGSLCTSERKILM